MNRQELEQRLSDVAQQYREAYQNAVGIVNEYMVEHPEGLSRAQQAVNHKGVIDSGNITQMVNDTMLGAAWIQDRLEGRTATTSNPTYRGSLTKKVRRMLGYTI